MGSTRNIQIYSHGGYQYMFQMFKGTCDYWYESNGVWTELYCPTSSAFPAFPMNRPDGYGMGIGINQGARTYDAGSGQWMTPDAYAGDVDDPMSQKPFIWNNNNPMQFQDPTGYDPFVIYNPNAADGFGHIEIAVVDHNTGKGTLWSAGPAHDGRPIDKDVITSRPITTKDIQKLKNDGDSVETEHTSASQDKAMNSTASQLQSADSQKHFNAFDNNCDLFTKKVLSAGDPAAGSSMAGVLPKNDFVNLQLNGLNLLDGADSPQPAPPQDQAPSKTY